MAVIVTIALIAGALVGIPVLATRGAGRRGVYLAMAIGFCLLGFGCYGLASGPQPLDPTPTEREGFEFIISVAIPLMLFYGAGVIGSLLGAALFRQSQLGTKVCPHCAERIQAAAAICRFCGREASQGAGATR